MENKMNWGTLILGIVIGAVVVSIVWLASKPSTTVAAPGIDIPDVCIRLGFVSIELEQKGIENNKIVEVINLLNANSMCN